MISKTKKRDGAYAEAAHSIRDKITNNIALVKRLAETLDVTFQPAVSYEDLISAGTLGLIEAARRYSSASGAKFSTFAYRRIRGAMLDLLRSEDPLGRSARAKLSAMYRAGRDYRAEHGRSPSVDELAELLDCPRHEVLRYLSYEKWNYIHSLEGQGAGGQRDDEDAGGILLKSDIDTPLEQLEKSDLTEHLTTAIKGLSVREQQVIVMYYYEELYMVEIAEVLGVTQSRVSQIHTEAIYNLERTLKEVLGDG